MRILGKGRALGHTSFLDGLRHSGVGALGKMYGTSIF